MVYSSMFSSECVDMKIARDLTVALRIKLKISVLISLFLLNAIVTIWVLSRIQICMIIISPRTWESIAGWFLIPTNSSYLSMYVIGIRIKSWPDGSWTQLKLRNSNVMYWHWGPNLALTSIKSVNNS